MLAEEKSNHPYHTVMKPAIYIRDLPARFTSATAIEALTKMGQGVLWEFTGQ